jgi:phosphoribosylglycinamide formyltransferase 1
MLNLAILGSTKGTSIQKTFDAISTYKLNAKIQIVVSNKVDAYILQRAKLSGIKSVCIESKGKNRTDFNKELLYELQKYPLDLIILVGYMKILDSQFTSYFKDKIINVHPSLLPKFAGGMDKDVHIEVIKSGEKTSGCTVHLVDEGIDTGKILLQKTCNISIDETADSLKSKVQDLESIALLEVVTNWESIAPRRY